MKKKQVSITRLHMSKETITSLSNPEQTAIQAGAPGTAGCAPAPLTNPCQSQYCFTAHNCVTYTCNPHTNSISCCDGV